ncbi:uncharacterized mitochondrial protein-like protein [Tanacetum coccineum]
MHPEERTAAKEVSLSSEEQALHDELVSLMHQESLAKAHNDDQRIAFEEEKRRISIAKGKEHVDSTFTLSTANTPPQSTGNTPTDSDDDISKDGVFSTNSFDAEEGGVADYNNMDPTIDVPSTPTLRIHKIHPQSQIIGKSTAGVQTRRKLQDSTSNQHQALLSFIYKQNRTNHKDQQTCLFACFLSQEEPKKVSQALADESWVEAMQEELLPIQLQRGYRVLCDLPSKRIGLELNGFLETKEMNGPSVKDFEDLMQKEFKMSSMGELTFFLGLQVKQSNGGIFLSQDKYVKDILNKFDFRTIKPASTPIEAHKSLGKDEEGEDVDVHTYRSMIGCLMYLTASRPDIMFAVCLCARFQVTPKVSHLHAVKRIFEVPQTSPKLVMEGCQYLGRRLVSGNAKKTNNCAISLQKQEYLAAASCCAQEITPLTPSMLEVVTTLAAEEEHSTSPHSKAASSARDARGSPTQSAAHSQRTASVQGTASFHSTAVPHDSDAVQGTDTLQGTATSQGTAEIQRTADFQASGQASAFFWVRNQNLKKQKRRRKKHKKKVAVSQIGSNKDEGTLSEEHNKKVMRLIEVNIEEKELLIPSSPLRPIQVVETEEQLKALNSVAILEPKRFGSFLVPYNLNLKQQLKVTDTPSKDNKNLQKLKYPQMKELYDKVQASIKDSFKDFIPMDSEKEREMLKERDAKRLLRKRKATIAEEQPSKKPKLRTETIDELRNYLRVVDFEKNAQDRESLEGISMITELQVIDSPDGEYLIIHRENNHFRAFDTLWEILHVLDRQDLYHLYRVVEDYYEHIPPSVLGLMLLGDLTIIWETDESSDDDFWKDQEEWEIIRWRFHESSGVHTLEIEDGTMIHMLAERRYPLSRELMIRMLDHGMEVEDETETAITLIHLFILWTTEDGDNS